MHPATSLAFWAPNGTSKPAVAFFTSMASLTVLGLIAYVLMAPMLKMMGATATVMPYSMDYARWILLASPFTGGTVVLSQILRAEGSTKMSMIGMICGCILNMALDPLFISVFGWGVAGAAIATSLSKVVSFIVLLSPFLRSSSLLDLKFKLFTPSKEIYGEIARMGIPTLLRSSMLTVSSIVTNVFAGGFGDYALAAVSVANKCTRLVGSAIMGLGQGFQPLAGYCWGAKNYKRVRQAFWTCSAMGAGAGLVLGSIMAFSATNLVGVFTSSNDTMIVKLGSYMIISQCITMIPHVWGMIANGLYQAVGRPVSAAVLGLSRQVIFLIPSVAILSALFGVYGLASAQAVADVLTALLALPMVIKLFKELKYKEAEQAELEAQGLAQADAPQMLPCNQLELEPEEI